MAKQYKYLDSFIDEQRANGKYSFTTENLHDQLDVSENALKKSLQRLKRQGDIVMIRRGFYVIVPPEYKAKGIIPTGLYINDLMKFLNRNYYVGLLNAAAYYGAAHQQPQNYSVITEGIALRPIKNDKVSIDFYIKKCWNKEDTAVSYTHLDVYKRQKNTGACLVRRSGKSHQSIHKKRSNRYLFVHPRPNDGGTLENIYRNYSLILYKNENKNSLCLYPLENVHPFRNNAFNSYLVRKTAPGKIVFQFC